MNIPKAIEILKGINAGIDAVEIPKSTDAIKLGIEALKYRKRLKEEGGILPGYFLPGETKD